MITESQSINLFKSTSAQSIIVGPTKLVSCSYCLRPYTLKNCVPLSNELGPVFLYLYSDPILYVTLQNCVTLFHKLGPVFLYLPQTPYLMSHSKTVSHCPINMVLYLP